MELLGIYKRVQAGIPELFWVYMLSQDGLGYQDREGVKKKPWER
jgi:hypothetical protein